MNYYNDNDPYVCEWLRNLIQAKLIPEGEVDERSIHDVSADDLRGFQQVHMFCGVGGWPLALRLAGWPDERPIITGSCPCQPWSAAGKKQGTEDERDLWPAFFRLIRQSRPGVVFGEQVPGAIREGWLDRVCRDLEAEGYAVGATVLGAHSVGAPHIRQRLFWAAQRLDDAAGNGREGGAQLHDQYHRQESGSRRESGRVADAECRRRESGEQQPPTSPTGISAPNRGAGRMADTEGNRRGQGCQESIRSYQGEFENPWSGPLYPRQVDWGQSEYFFCRDGKARRVGTGIRVLADGVLARSSKLRAYGNAIVPASAAVFVKAFLEAEGEIKNG